jgi:hypothetical protein
VQCAFAPNRIETAEHLSKLTGQTTVVKEQITTSGRGWSTNVSCLGHGPVLRHLLASVDFQGAAVGPIAWVKSSVPSLPPIRIPCFLSAVITILENIGSINNAIAIANL